MTLVSSIITDAYRESNLIPMGTSPNTNQITEALNRLNPLILLSVGQEVGDEFRDLNYGGDYDQSDCILNWIPDNIRLVFNLDAAVTLYADPHPYEGQRLAFVDAGGNLATYNVIIDGNGRNIEGASSVTLSTNSDSRQWVYRADTGNWVKIETLETADQMPFGSEFDDYYIIMLAMRINPRYGQNLAPETLDSLRRTRSALRSRFRCKDRNVPSDPGLVNPNDYIYDNSMNSFYKGRAPWT